jgi:hypothetical protein
MIILSISAMTLIIHIGIFCLVCLIIGIIAGLLFGEDSDISVVIFGIVLLIVVLCVASVIAATALSGFYYLVVHI